MVEFLYPYSFLLLVFLLLFLKKGVQYKFNPKLIVNKSNTKFKSFLLALSLIFFIIALARPVTDKKEIHSNINMKKVVLALDISQSMLASDVYPNRLTFAKHKMEQFIDKFNGEIAIMAFSDSAFLISPYTTDKDSLKYLLNNINTNYITSNGTDFENLLKTAKKMGYKDLVVFSDGGEMKNLNTDNVNLYTLLIGNKPSPIKLKNGSLLTQNNKVVMVGINKDIFKFSKFGVIASNSDSDIRQLISQNFQKVNNKKTITVYKELFIYPLSLGILFLFFAFFSLPRFRKIIKVAPLFLIFITIKSNAGLLDWYYLDKAKQAYNQNNYQASLNYYKKVQNSEFNQADSLYKMKKYKEALKLYQKINNKKLKEEILYNEGNCFAKLGEIDKAIQSYKEALKLNPNDKDAKYNLELLEKKKKQNKKNRKNNNSKNQKKQKKNQQKKDNNQNKKQHKKENKNKKNEQDNKEKKKINKHTKPQENKEHKNKMKKEFKKLKPIQIKPSKNSQIYNKVKSQTLMLPLSKGESKNEW